MLWSEVCHDQTLQNLPYKIELNEWGNIVMSPASNRHGNIQTKIAFHLMTLMESGTVLTESSIMTPKGVKVADVVWASAAFLEKYRWETPYPNAPEVCVEVKSPSNTEGEMEEKRRIYLSQGAREYWLCDEEGDLSFYDRKGRLEKSGLFPEMPARIAMDMW
uniref:Restriction endonuclease n=1 Tax=Candidatus Kentrum sp. FW TaxID=2126338 RepID=A0A450T9U7_9GAMM|nr:MAG: Putative restriction endonuclease [Candidatus Kentron sp. FW]